MFFDRAAKVIALFFASAILHCAAWGPLNVWGVEFLPNYLSGPETCAKHLSERTREIGKFLDVPVDYFNPQRGFTPLYYWTLKPIQPFKPTVVFVVGGPGGSSHQAEFLDLDEDLNMVYFDQRGVSCSRPLSETLYRDPTFYSAEAIARDIEEIRKDLGIEQISVYGHSYGTVPATVYGHYFPQQTRGLILEGTLFDAGVSLYQSAWVHDLVQRKFDSLSLDSRNQILKLSQDPRLEGSWYSRLNQFLMFMDDPFALLDRYFENVFSADVPDPVDSLMMFSRRKLQDEEFGFSAVMYGMIGCRELAMTADYASFFSTFDPTGKLSFEKDSSELNGLCRQLGVTDFRFYSAEFFPVNVPVTYFQGEFDGATEYPGALRHFKSVPQRFAQFFGLERGGHLPNQSFLVEPAKTSVAHQLERKIFYQAVLGHPISSDLIEAFNHENALQWHQRFR